MSHFAKRHYEAIATIMQITYPEGFPEGASTYEIARRDQWYATRNALVAKFGGDNPRFNVSRFEIACMPGSNIRARSSVPSVDRPWWNEKV